MVKLLSILSIVLAVVLFPPAALALISNNAVPGDATYPIKRVLEDGIFAVASLNPTTKAWFAAARSDRRFKEFTTLVAQGKQGEDTLNELVEQTQVAATQIAEVNDEGQKQQLIEQLSKSIKKYDQGLQQVSSPAPVIFVPAEDAVVDSIQPEPIPQEPAVQPQPTSIPAPTSQPTPASVPTGVRPTPTVVPTPISTPRPTSTPILPGPNNADRQRQINEARRQLGEIKNKLEEEQKKQHESRKELKQEKKQEQKEEKKEEPNLTPKIDAGKLNKEKR